MSNLMSKAVAELPVGQHLGEIVDAVRKSQVTIIVGETGSGKSTLVPLGLLAAEYSVVVTQPRRLAARAVATRCAELLAQPVGELVGFRTSQEQADSAQTQVLFCTDGLQLVRELYGAAGDQVLVLDEVHEWNLNIEVLVAWAKRCVEADPNFRVVLMSATLEADRLAEYFGQATVIEVPGRLFPVEERHGSYLETEAAELARAGRNVLVFQPGKSEIEETIRDLRASLGEETEILPLHGQLSPEEQQRVFRHYRRPKVVVSTNVAQTSVTIDDIDAVVDSGIERRVEVVDGVQGLYLHDISQADCAQRAGRAGRTKPGVYVLCSQTALDRREAFPTAEIERSRLDQTVLRLALAGLDAEELDFFHQPSREAIAEAKSALHRLGAIDESGEVTNIGRAINRLPIDIHRARMVVEAESRGVLDDVVTIAAIMEAGGITHHRNQGWRALTDETESDLLAQLDCFNAAGDLSREQMHEVGLMTKSYYRVREIRSHLYRALKGKIRWVESTGDRLEILKSVCAGMVDHLYRYDYGRYRNGGIFDRELSNASVVRGADWLAGQPFDLQVKSRRGGMITLRLIEFATRVDPAWLVEVAPQLVTTQTGLMPDFDQESGAITSVTRTIFNGQVVSEERAADPTHPEAARLRESWRIYANDRQLSTWRNQPMVPLPESIDDLGFDFPIVEATYGRDVVNGTPLVAYGTASVNQRRHYQTDSWSATRWYKTLEEAEQARAELCATLKAAREEQLRVRELAEVVEVAESARQQAAELVEQYDQGDSVLCDELVQRINAWLPQGTESLQQWTTETKALIAKAEAELAARIDEGTPSAESLNALEEMFRKH